MEDRVAECIELINKELEKQLKKHDHYEVTGLAQMGKVQGLEIALKLLTEYHEEFC